jgi:hypothetical protein
MSIRDEFARAIVSDTAFPLRPHHEDLEVAHSVYDFAQALVDEKLLRDKTDQLDPAQVKADKHQCGLGAIDPQQPRPLIEVEMRTKKSPSGDGTWTWQCQLGTVWLTSPGTPSAECFRSAGAAEENGYCWLAALGDHLGLLFEAKWAEQGRVG